ncbi:hypothetical protein RvY_18332 [Ramazzottius varieornatus]|uniref:Transmembrane protein 231 n=1 Tax=Ramazzottius varieornatus TaxID=947166 RepID=A0A1D1W723_RAMVA|nr:hypothetical protein RvY_18332 [Ramazzottius varieornatus]
MKMAYMTVYNQDVQEEHKGSLTSAAVLVQLLLLALTLAVPIALLAINSDIWPLYTTIYEQPLVRYQQMAMINMETTSGSVLTWSTMPQYNQLMTSAYRPAVLRSKEEDLDEDKKPDRFQLTLDIPLDNDERIVGFTFILFFDFILRQRSNFRMSTVAIIQHNSASPCSQFLADGSLRLVQTSPLPPQGSEDYSLQDPIINMNSSSVNDFSLSSLMQNGAFRKARTILDTTSPICVKGPQLNQPFHMEVTVHFPVVPVWVQTTILHRLTTAGAAFTFWLLPFFLFSCLLRKFLFSNALLSTVSTSKYSMKHYMMEK